MLRFRFCKSFPSWRNGSVPTNKSVSCNASRKFSSLSCCQVGFVPGSGREFCQPRVQNFWQSSNMLAAASECLPLGMAAHSFVRLDSVSLCKAGTQALCSCNASNQLSVSALLTGSEKISTVFATLAKSFPNNRTRVKQHRITNGSNSVASLPRRRRRRRG